jgi:hypothetical protein
MRSEASGRPKSGKSTRTTKEAASNEEAEGKKFKNVTKEEKEREKMLTRKPDEKGRLFNLR